MQQFHAGVEWSQHLQFFNKFSNISEMLHFMFIIGFGIENALKRVQTRLCFWSSNFLILFFYFHKQDLLHWRAKSKEHHDIVIYRKCDNQANIKLYKHASQLALDM